MKQIYNSISLRTRITLLTGAVILAVSIALTLTSMHNAGRQIGTIDISAAPSVSVTRKPYEIQNEPDKEIDASLRSEDEYVMSFQVSKREAERAFNVWSIVSLVLFSVGGMGLAWLLAGQALAPVRRLEAAVTEISARNLSARLPVPAARDEVGRLTDAFNDMLARLEQSFAQQKRFSSSVAHELKTPLATMKMSLQVARMEGQADGELLAVTERGVDRLIGVVSSLLDLTNESLADLHERIALCDLLRETADELAALYEARGLRVSRCFVREPIVVSGSPALVHRLFGNLIENAMKYNVQGGEVRLSVMRLGDGSIQVSVEDTGSGIPEEALPHIFEPFYCVDPSRSRRLGGAGLGLSVAQAIAQQHGWALSAHNRVGGGAVFLVTIPAEQIEQAGSGQCLLSG